MADNERIAVEVRLFATLRRKTSNGVNVRPSETFRMAGGTTVADIVSKLGVPEADVRVVVVNGRKVSLTHRLHDGDVLGLFPAVVGG